MNNIKFCVTKRFYKTTQATEPVWNSFRKAWLKSCSISLIALTLVCVYVYMLANTYRLNEEVCKFLNHILPEGSFGRCAGNTRTILYFNIWTLEHFLSHST